MNPRKHDDRLAAVPGGGQREKAQVFGIQRSGAGFSISRRSFLRLAAAAAAGGAALQPKKAHAADASDVLNWAHKDGVMDLVVSPDGKVLISAGLDKLIKFWSLPQGGYYRNISLHATGVTALAISKDGKTLVSGDNSGLIRLWSVRTAPRAACFAATRR